MRRRPRWSRRCSRPSRSPRPAPIPRRKPFTRTSIRKARSVMAVITMREAISQALWEEMERDERVIILGEEVGVWGGTYAVTKGFYDHFGPERVRDTPIAEAVIVGGAQGGAMGGPPPGAGGPDPHP